MGVRLSGAGSAYRPGKAREEDKTGLKADLVKKRKAGETGGDLKNRRSIHYERKQQIKKRRFGEKHRLISM